MDVSVLFTKHCKHQGVWLLRLGMTEEKQVFLLSCSRLAHFGFAQDRLRLGMKNKNRGFCFVLLSPCAIFAPCDG